MKTYLLAALVVVIIFIAFQMCSANLNHSKRLRIGSDKYIIEGNIYINQSDTIQKDSL